MSTMPPFVSEENTADSSPLSQANMTRKAAIPPSQNKDLERIRQALLWHLIFVTTSSPVSRHDSAEITKVLRNWKRNHEAAGVEVLVHILEDMHMSKLRGRDGLQYRALRRACRKINLKIFAVRLHVEQECYYVEVPETVGADAGIDEEFNAKYYAQDGGKEQDEGDYGDYDEASDTWNECQTRIEVILPARMKKGYKFRNRRRMPEFHPSEDELLQPRYFRSSA
ncbi:hypothetical protein CC80DRAFT_508713 [Byssothecium circinans]|uniref:Uncharacterized protein n=1 Tax=Byssothecium circinans TaxID=147558 RepID=A0A6A5TFC7_9PLEO|nr:hypothetical protein CC80DRAFT_508713 [Byssothecium circinans]